MIVAQLRGAKFKTLGSSGYLVPEMKGDDSDDIAFSALWDVADWLGYSSTDIYNSDLPYLKKKIFKRARY